MGPSGIWYMVQWVYKDARLGSPIPSVATVSYTSNLARLNMILVIL